ncbi:major facilitator superfamily transporter [Phlegmacium glaucopus]|nr:major facilitator superfamily transporter [Phlegmacium glaucopus]
MDGSIANECHNEQTPLIHSHQGNVKRTPLPKLQIGILLFLQINEPLCSMSIYPYINELVSKLDIIGGDTRKIGYYAGLIESLFFATEALTVFQWSRTSDRIGRKPVLLIGLAGTFLSMQLFGLSRTFWTLVISRCLCGLLNGNIGVMKSCMGELTDPTNRAEAFALMPVIWAFGASMGPLLGGSLARPSDHFPTIFTGGFWKQYPYYLPCLAAGIFLLLTLVIVAVFFQEPTSPAPSYTSDIECDVEEALPTREQEFSFCDLLTFPVMISIANYVILAFLSISVSALLPLFFHMPIPMGGLDLDPVAIGYIMGTYGAGTGLFQFLFFARIVRQYGTRHVFILSLSMFIPLFAMFPVISIVSKGYGVDYWVVWVLVGLMLFLLFFIDMAYGCIFMYVTEAAPSRSSLGAINGFAQTTASVARAVGPALSTSLYSFSVQHDLLGGYGVYAIFGLLATLSMFVAIQLPRQTQSNLKLKL